MTPRFPRDIPKKKALRALNILGFHVVREGNHIALVRENEDGSRTPLTMPNHPILKGSTIRAICTQAGISREAFLKAYLDS